MPPKKILNPKTGRYVLQNGDVGRRLLEMQKKGNAPKNRAQSSASSEYSDESDVSTNWEETTDEEGFTEDGETDDGETDGEIDDTCDTDDDRETDSEESGNDETDANDESVSSEEEKNPIHNKKKQVTKKKEYLKSKKSKHRVEKQEDDDIDDDILLKPEDIKDFRLTGKLMPLKKPKI